MKTLIKFLKMSIIQVLYSFEPQRNVIYFPRYVTYYYLPFNNYRVWIWFRCCFCYMPVFYYGCYGYTPGKDFEKMLSCCNESVFGTSCWNSCNGCFASSPTGGKSAQYDIGILGSLKFEI